MHRSAQSFHEYPNAPAAGKTHAPRGFIRNAEIQHLGLAISDDIHRFSDNSAFYTTARDRAVKISICVDDKLAANWTRG
jgi:hypothetical protein